MNNEVFSKSDLYDCVCTEDELKEAKLKGKKFTYDEKV